MIETVLIHNIGKLVSGDISNPILDADAVLIKGGLIKQIGSYEKFKNQTIDTDIDIQGMTLCPGLIDSHAHACIGDWSPRARTLGWMASSIQGGVTTLISMGEVLMPRPHDAAGVKALAITAHKTYENYRPGGVKAHCGALVLEEGLTEADVKEVADAGAWLFAEIGIGGLRDFNKIKMLVQAGRKHGFKIPMHFGPQSLPETPGGSVDEIININPDVVVHFNGGPTACSFPEMKKLASSCASFLELVSTGNPKALNYAITLLRERNEFQRLILGTDSPGGSGSDFLGIIRLVGQISSLHGIPAEIVLAMATGNSARAYGLNTGIVKPEKEADFIVIDPPVGSQGKTALEALECGDRANMGMVMVDGKVIARTLRQIFPTTKKVLINGEEDHLKFSDVMFS